MKTKTLLFPLIALMVITILQVQSCVKTEEEETFPIATFFASPTKGSSPLTVNFTDFSENAENWHWDFGDGGTSSRQSPTYTYTNAGSYTVSLTVTNKFGITNKETKADYIVVDDSIPKASFYAAPTSGEPPLTVHFADQSTNNPTGWDWDFGDGNTSSVQNPVHTYDTVGSFTVSLKVNNDHGYTVETKTSYINVSAGGPAPEAYFTAGPTNGPAPLSVSFTDYSTEDPTSWQWDFGDGWTSEEQNPVHTYNYEGTYSVKLTASNQYGSNAITKIDCIEVSAGGSPPVAAFSSSPTGGEAPLSVSFVDQSSNAPTGWQWDFGDGGTSSLRDPVYTYNAAGTYTVALTVSNAYGSDTEEKIDYITVTGGGGNTGEPCPGTPTVTDNDGNVYNTVLIGSQCWMKENLKTTTYRNGTPIPNITGGYDWWHATTGAYVWYDNDISWKDIYGAIYNWKAIIDANGLCPQGWHVPGDNEWKTLEMFLGMSQSDADKVGWDRGTDEGQQLKSITGWFSNNGTDEVGFTALPGGWRYDSGGFYNMSYFGRWWSSTAASSTHAWYRALKNVSIHVNRDNYYKEGGNSVRCIRDY